METESSTAVSAIVNTVDNMGEQLMTVGLAAAGASIGIFVLRRGLSFAKGLIK